MERPRTTYPDHRHRSTQRSGRGRAAGGGRPMPGSDATCSAGASIPKERIPVTRISQGSHDQANDAGNFSLVLGGPLYQLFRRAHLAGDGHELVRRRVIVIALVAWLPLLLLSLAQGTAIGSAVAIPF